MHTYICFGLISYQHVVGVDLYVPTSVGHAVPCALWEYRGGLPSDVPPCRFGARPCRAEGGCGEKVVQMILPYSPAGLPAVGILGQGE